MKAFVIASEISVHFASYDDEFLDKLKYWARNDLGPDHLLSSEPSENSHILHALLLPTILSCTILQNHFNDTCEVISCKKVGCNLAFKRHGNLLYIAFCNTGECSLYHVRKQLYVLNEMNDFLFGPCNQNSAAPGVAGKKRTWERLSDALNTYAGLYDKEVSLLLGGVERLMLNDALQNQYNQIVHSSMKLLDQNIKNERITFGVLFVKCKLVAYEFNAKFNHRLSTADFLKILVLINSKYEEVDTLDSMLDASSAVDAIDLSYSDEDISSHGQNSIANSACGDELLDIPATAEGRLSRSPRIPILKCEDVYDSSSAGSSPVHSKKKSRNKVRKSLSWANTTDSKKNHNKSSHGTKSLDRNIISPRSVDQGAGCEITITECNETLIQSDFKSFPIIQEEVGTERQKQNFKCEIPRSPVFLRTASCHYTPFLMHILPVLEDITFVVLAEMKGGDVADVICKFLSHLALIKFIDNKREHRVSIDVTTYEAISSYCKRLKSKLKHASDNQVERIINLWEKQISPLLFLHLKQQKIDVARLEQSVSELVKNLQKIFERLFLTNQKTIKESWKEQIMIVRNLMQKELKDHQEFLYAKTYRNLCLGWTHSEYPGLLHFVLAKRLKYPFSTGISNPVVDEQDNIYISGLRIPPLLDETETDKHVVYWIKRQVWKGVEAAYAKIDGKYGISKFSSTVEDLKFTSYVWVRPSVELSSGKQSGVSLTAKLKTYSWSGKASIAGTGSPFWSVETINGFTGQFFLFELHLVHFSTVSESMIEEQCHKLMNEFKSSKLDI